jgi:hemerythrin-like metal-binding protein
MALIQWTAKMSVGLEELDEDHKLLIKVINQLDENARDAGRQEVVRQCLMALRRYAEHHFGREEKVLSACDFPGIEVQKDEHRRFIERIRAATANFDEDPQAATKLVNEELLDFLGNWLNHHILIEDMAYRPFVEKSAAAKEAARRFRAVEVSWSP